MHRVTKNSVGEGGVSYTDARKNFQNAVSAGVLLRKSFRNGVPARLVTEVPLVATVAMLIVLKDFGPYEIIFMNYVLL
jgi:hypothetical protein